MKRLFVCALLAGCGGDDSGSGGQISLDNLGSELATESCSKMFECCTDAEIMAQFMGIKFEGQPITTEEQCTSFTTAFFVGFAVESYKASIAAGRIDYDADAAGDCLAVLRGVSCSEYSSAQTGPDDFAGECRPFIVAKVGDGGGCTQDYECTSDNCDGATVQPGGPNTDGVCKPKPTAGQACQHTCADDLYCGYDQTAGMQICQATKSDGAQCSSDHECKSDECNANMMCAAAAPTCDGR